MLHIDIPGFGNLEISHLLLDYNGTLAVEGHLIKRVASELMTMIEEFQLQIHIITGDTFGTAKEELADLDCHLTILPSVNQAAAKVNYLHQLQSEKVIAIGNGKNDKQMLKEAAIGIAIVGEEGAASETVMAADIVVSNILHAFELLKNPQRLIATLRT